ncbi:TPA: hypothetical protein ACGWSO_004267 [Pseudomonas aeruginosa]
MFLRQCFWWPATTAEIDSVIVAGTLKEPMAKTPAWLQAVWINVGQLTDQQQQAAA